MLPERAPRCCRAGTRPILAGPGVRDVPQNGRNASRSSAAPWCDASPSASPRNVARSDDPPVDKSGKVNPVIGSTPRFTDTLMKRCAPSGEGVVLILSTIPIYAA